MNTLDLLPVPVAPAAAMPRRSFLGGAAAALVGATVVALVDVQANLAEDCTTSEQLARVEQTIDLLRTRHICDGWKLDEAAAERVLRYFRTAVHLPKTHEDQPGYEDDWMSVVHFISDHGQSFDWLLAGDVGGMICGAAGRSRAAAKLQTDPIFAAIEQHRQANAAYKEVARIRARYDDVRWGRKHPRPRVCVGEHVVCDYSRTEIEGRPDSFILTATPTGAKEPIYVTEESEIIKCRRNELDPDAHLAWVERCVAEFREIERRWLRTYGRSKLGKLDRAVNQASSVERNAIWDLIWIEPTTSVGLAALLAYYGEVDGPRELVRGNDEWEMVAHWTMSAAANTLAGISRPPMSEVVIDVASLRDDDPIFAAISQHLDGGYGARGLLRRSTRRCGERRSRILSIVPGTRSAIE